ncbi:P60-like protein [Ascodesmis nigricans]|uniref:Ribosome biogenesis protein NOP53 n=1 Tax=Ascodesmis nigricans TaxID=341454 RepID=A0A4S2N1U8_9PEZI|nr:P60-like protein [Ascodesmis nigricans]
MPSKQPSRKGKKAWRKNVDITDVQSGLEQVREEIAQGGVIAEKADTELFALDFGGDASIPKREKQTKVLRCDQILASRSAVPAVSSRKRTGNPALGDGIIPLKKHRTGYVSRSEVQKLKAIAHGQTEASVAAKLKTDDFHDPWAEPAPLTPAQLEAQKKSFVEEKMPVKAPKTLKHKPVVLSTAEKEVPAVKLPDAGISYNPEFAKWDKLLREEGAKEVEVEKKRLAAEEEERRIQELREMADEPTEEFDDESSDEESSSDEDEDEDEDEEESNEAKAVKAEVKRKTQAQKNREKRRKEQERKREAELKEKQMQRELMLVRKYERDVKAAERARMAKALAKRAKLESTDPNSLRKKRFGKIELPRPALEVQLPDELADSLRRLKPEGNLLSDRFRSIRERGIVEHRAPIIQAKKLRRATTEKWSYKDFK